MVDSVPNYGRDKVWFEETELRLGLPGGGDKINANYGKRGFEETVDLKLNLSPKEMPLDQGINLKDKSLNKTEAVKPPAK